MCWRIVVVWFFFFMFLTIRTAQFSSFYKFIKIRKWKTVLIWLALLTVDCWLLTVDCWLLTVDCWLLTVDCWLLTVDCWLLTVDCWLLTVDCWLLTVDCWLLTVDCWLLTVDCWLLTPSRLTTFVLLIVDRVSKQDVRWDILRVPVKLRSIPRIKFN